MGTLHSLLPRIPSYLGLFAKRALRLPHRSFSVLLDHLYQGRGAWLQAISLRALRN
jgi:hypothetical protein